MRFFLLCLCLTLACLTALADDGDYSPGSKTCPFDLKPSADPNCVISCGAGGWQKQCSGAPSTTGGSTCSEGTAPPIIKPGCSNQCENGSWKQMCPPGSSCDPTMKPIDRQGCTTICTGQQWQQTCSP